MGGRDLGYGGGGRSVALGLRVCVRGPRLTP